MRDPFNWSLPIGRVFGVTVRIHLLFPFVIIGLLLRVAYQRSPAPSIEGSWLDMAMVLGLLFFVVLLHEFGHCFGARLVDGDADEVLLWPLGGLANVEVPHTPRANFIATAAGPAVNFVICLMVGLLMMYLHYRPTWNPVWYPLRIDPLGTITLFTLSGEEVLVNNPAVILLARLFWVSWVLFLINVLIPGFPLDGGRLLQSILWPRFGYATAMWAAIMAGFISMILIGIFAVMTSDVLTICLAWFIYVNCRQQLILLETGGEESVFGYDFSHGYTSLERDAPPRRKKPNFFQRWRQQRAARKLQRELEEREAEERRMDELLAKIQRDGQGSLTDEERRFLTRVSAKYRNRS